MRKYPNIPKYSIFAQISASTKFTAPELVPGEKISKYPQIFNKFSISFAQISASTKFNAYFGGKKSYWMSGKLQLKHDF